MEFEGFRAGEIGLLGLELSCQRGQSEEDSTSVLDSRVSTRFWEKRTGVSLGGCQWVLSSEVERRSTSARHGRGPACLLMSSCPS